MGRFVLLYHPTATRVTRALGERLTRGAVVHDARASTDTLIEPGSRRSVLRDTARQLRRERERLRARSIYSRRVLYDCNIDVSCKNGDGTSRRAGGANCRVPCDGSGAGRGLAAQCWVCCESARRKSQRRPHNNGTIHKSRASQNPVRRSAGRAGRGGPVDAAGRPRPAPGSGVARRSTSTLRKTIYAENFRRVTVLRFHFRLWLHVLLISFALLRTKDAPHTLGTNAWQRSAAGYTSRPPWSCRRMEERCV